jgi:flagellar biosynthesis protein FlhG
MHDQANELRQLVKCCVTPTLPVAAKRPGVIAVAGGKGGVGTTTVAVNLAFMLSRRELRTVLVDAAGSGGAGALCQIEPRHCLADVLAGRSALGEAIQPGPERLQIVPGMWGLENQTDFTATAMDRLFTQLPGLGDSTDIVVLDAGNSASRMAGRCWQEADAVLAVTTPHSAAVMETYAAIKLLWPRERSGAIHLLVNMAADRQSADDVYNRLAKACHRFLAVQVLSAGHVAVDASAGTHALGSATMRRQTDVALDALLLALKP